MEELKKGYEFTKAQLAELESLRAWKAEIEKQEPVAHEYQDTEGNWKPFIDERHYQNTLESGQWKIRDLFAAPVVSPDVAALKANSTTCNWEYDDSDNFWSGECGIAFCIEEETPSKNEMNYCPKCGGKLVEFVKVKAGAA